MSAQHPNTFLSRVFGVNSTYPGDETELSSIRNNLLNSEEAERLILNEHSQGQRDRSMIESDQEYTDSEVEDHELQESIDLNTANHVNFTTDLNKVEESEDDEPEEETRDDFEVPLSIMVHPTPEEQNAFLNPPKLRQPIPNNIQQTERQQSTPKHISFKRDPQNIQNPSTSLQAAAVTEEERKRRAKLGILNPKERALWKWANIENLDKFLQDVYAYYSGSGYYCIVLKKVFDLATLVFVVCFASYLTSCIDYSKLKLPSSKRLDDITVDQCYAHMSLPGKFSLFLFFIYFVLKVFQVYVDTKELSEIHNFYKYLLEISEKDLQTISWQVVTKRLMLLKDQNAITSNVSDMKSKSRIDAHDIANRIMRKENYYIALFNRDILDLTLPVPGYGKNFLTKTLEWNLQLCISGFIFNEHGQIRQNILKESKRKEMSEDLKKRFMLAGLLNIILSPLLVLYFIFLYFFRYFNEYRSNPGLIGARQYTPLAEWKFREFNELYHIFQKRLYRSVPEAAKYVDQFPKEITNVIVKFVAFVSGSFAAVLLIISLVDSDISLSFEITPGRTVFFYIGVFGTLSAVILSSLPAEYQVYDSESNLLRVAEFTHYLPQHWEGKYHTDEVRAEFCEYFALKALLLLKEIASLVITPFILWFSLPRSTDRIIDFFREYSVHVDGLGYVCTFAMFDFEKANSKRKPKSNNVTHYNSGEEKMMKSYLYFLESYGDNNETQRNGNNGPLPVKPSIAKPQTSLNQSILEKFQQNQGWPARDHNEGFIESIDPKRKGHVTGTNLRERTVNDLHSEHGLAGSFITTLPKTDVNEYENVKEPGVLGLVNQFYKDYDIAH